MAAKGFIELLRLADRGRIRRDNLIAGESRWSGVAFEMQSHLFVAPLGDVAEVIYNQALTSVPHTHSWMMGIANLRGRLLSVLNLAGFCGQPNSVIEADSKIICLSHPEHAVGVMVDRVYGIQHFDTRGYFGRSPSEDVLPEQIARFCQGHYTTQGKVWHVFMLRDLFNDPQFMQPSR